MMGLTFKMYCNDNVEDDTYSNCIGQDDIEICLSRALHLYGPLTPPLGFVVQVVGWLGVGFGELPCGRGSPLG